MAWILTLINGRERTLAYLVAVGAVIVCWGLVAVSGDAIRSFDEKDFFSISQNLALHGTFAVDLAEPTAYRAPGLVFFMAPFVYFGADLTVVRLANAVLIGPSLVLLFHLVCRHSSPRAGLVAVMMVPLWPPVLYAAITMYPQTLAAFLLLLTLFLIDRLSDKGQVLAAVWVGLAFGALILTVPATLLLMPIFLIWLVKISRRRLVHGLLFCVVSGLLVSTWTARNFVVFGEFVPVATSSGYNLLAGNAPEARYNTSLNIRFPEYVYTEITGKSEVERSKIMTQAALAEISKDPQRFVQRYIGKFLHWFHFSNRLMSDEVLEGGAHKVDVSTREIILFVTYLMVVFGPLVLHVALARRVPFRAIDYLFLALWIGSGLAYALFFTRVRFRLPFDWLIIASNAMFLVLLVEDYLRRYRDRPTAIK